MGVITGAIAWVAKAWAAKEANRLIAVASVAALVLVGLIFAPRTLSTVLIGMLLNQYMDTLFESVRTAAGPREPREY